MKTRKVNEAPHREANFNGINSARIPQKHFNTLILILFKWLLPAALMAGFISCTNNDQLVQNYKALHQQDSLLVVHTQTEDSAIKGYIHTLNDIQDNLDQIKTKEKIISVNNGENTGGYTAVADIKALDKLIITSNKEIGYLHAKMNKMNSKDKDMEDLIAHITVQLGEKDSEIAALQGGLAKVNNSYLEITKQFNDSVAVIQQQNAKIGAITTEMNTVYYAIGTMKELKENKVINETGGIAGIGRGAEVKPDLNSSYFTRTDLTKLSVIPLNAKFKKLISTHPMKSYRITGNKQVDSLVITNPASFWSENKYLVIAVK